MLRIITRCNVRFLFVLFLACAGCGTSQPVSNQPATPTIPKPISILFVESHGLGEEMTRRWTAATGGEATYTEMGATNFSTDRLSASSGHDVIVYPATLTGELVAADVVVEVPDATWNSTTLESRGLLRNNRTTLARFGARRIAIPISNPHYMLFVRQELLDASSAIVPKTWDELVDLIEQSEATVTEFEYPVGVPCAPGWAAKSFLAIAASEIRQRGNLNTLFDRRTVKPLLINEPFVKALKRLKKLAGNRITGTPQSVIDDYLAGKTPIALGWLNRNFDLGTGEESDAFAKTLVSRLPGTNQTFDAGSGTWSTIDGGPHRVEFTGFASIQASILKSASHPMDVYQFLQWLGSKQTTSSIVSASDIGSPTRAAHLGDIQAWTGDVLDQNTLAQYSDLLLQASDSPIQCSFPRIPGSGEYLAALESAVQGFLAGETDAESALKQASAQWETITEKFGRKSQAGMLRQDERL